MLKFNQESILLLQQKLYKHTGQQAYVRDWSLLDSAIQSAFQTFDGYDLYPTVEEKGARIGFNIISNHPFVDGNKRFGILIMLCFLEMNDVHLKCSNQEIINIGLSLASGKTSYNALVNWVNSHKVNPQTIKTDDENIR